MKYIIVFYFISLTFLFAAPKEKQLVSPEVAMELLETIKKDAIILGNGDIEVHTFIDPLCKMSQRYLALLYKRHYSIFSQYTIYLYLHEIKSKNSKNHIYNIMNAKFPSQMLYTIMIDKDMSKLQSLYSGKSRRTFKKIADVAHKIGVYKRPYIMIHGKAK